MTQFKSVPQLLVEKQVLGELTEAGQSALRDRLEAAGELDRIAQINASNADILQQYPPAQLAASIRMRAEKATQKNRLVTVGIPVFASVALAAMILFAVMPHSVTRVAGPPGLLPGTGSPLPGTATEPYVGIKGDAQLHILQKTATGATPLRSGDRVAQGDTLQVKMNTGHATSAVICSVDGRGNVTLLYPESETASTQVTPLSKQKLSFGYELDDAPQFERFFMVWSDASTPVTVDEVLTSVKSLQHPQTDPLQLSGSLKSKDVLLKK